MVRGEFAVCEGSLRQHAFSVEPHEFEASLREDGFWLGLSWRQVAKMARVQLTLWADDGWMVPSCVRLGVVQRAMELHESGSAVCDTGEALCATLLSDRFRRRLESMPRVPCARCGAVGDTRRTPSRRDSSGCVDKACYCERCLRGG